MNREERAKQFAPFDALKGLREALEKKEKECESVDRRDLSEDEETKIGTILERLEKGNTVEVCRYKDRRYEWVKGNVAELMIGFKYIKVNKEKIYFEDILDINKIN